jgi:hypothetical protein
MMAVSKRTRFEVLRRDNHTCRYCGSVAPDVKITVDHVTPITLGGGDSSDNLVAACWDCNAGKASTDLGSPLVADVAEDARRWAACMVAAAATRSLDREARSHYVAAFEDQWTSWTFASGPRKDAYMPTPADWEHTVWRFFEASLPIDELLDAAQIACGNQLIPGDDKWRYMCGIAWKKLTELQDAAKVEMAATSARADALGVGN